MGAGKICCVCFFAIGFIVASILIACSFATLTPLQAGIRDNTVTKSIQTGRVYLAGRWHVGLGRSFIKFPTTYQTIKFSADKGSDGVALSVNSPIILLECSLQYQLNVSMLISTYRNFSTSYHSRFVKVAKDIIQSNTDATHFTTPQFYTHRRLIADSLFIALKNEMAAYGAVVRDFQLLSVTLQQTTQQTIVTNIVQAQNAEIALLNGQIQLIDTNTKVIQGEQQQQIQFYLANTTRDATIITQNAAANVTRIRLDADAASLFTIKSNLSFTNEEMLQYLWLRNLRVNSSQSKLAVGLTNPILSP